MKLQRYRFAGSDPDTIHEVFTIGEVIHRLATIWHPWEIHRFDQMAVVHFLN